MNLKEKILKMYSDPNRVRKEYDPDLETSAEPTYKLSSYKDYVKNKKSEVDLPKYTRSPYADYKMLEGKVMDAHSDLKIKKNGKREITTKMKIWQHLTPRDKADLKRSIMLALNHKFKGGSISDFPKEVRGVVNEVYKHMTGGAFIDDLNRASAVMMPKKTENLNKAVDKMKRFGKGFDENYYKPKGHRQLIYFSDSSSEEDEPHVPVKRGRGRPKCT